MKNMIDKKTPYALIKEFSKTWEKVEEPTKSQIESIFELNKTEDFYHGVLSALSSALSYQRDFRPKLNPRQLEEVLTMLVAYSSKILKEKIDTNH